MSVIDNWEDNDDSYSPEQKEIEFNGNYDDLVTDTVTKSNPITKPNINTKPKTKKQLIKENIARKENESNLKKQFNNKQNDEQKKMESDFDHTLNLFKNIDISTGDKSLLMAKTMGSTLVEHSQSENYPLFLKEFIKVLANNVTVDDIEEITNSLNVIMNDKIKQSKGKKSQKKTKTSPFKENKKGTNNIETNSIIYDDYDDIM